MESQKISQGRDPATECWPLLGVAGNPASLRGRGFRPGGWEGVILSPGPWAERVSLSGCIILSSGTVCQLHLPTKKSVL